MNNCIRKYTDVLNSTWQGLNLKQMIEDKNVVKKYFQWLQNWPTKVAQEFSWLVYHLLKTRTNDVADVGYVEMNRNRLNI